MKKNLKALAVCSFFALLLLSGCNNGQENSGFGKLTLTNISSGSIHITQVTLDPEIKNGSKDEISETVQIEANQSKTWTVASGNYTISVSCNASKTPALRPVTITSDKTINLNFTFDGNNPLIYGF